MESWKDETSGTSTNGKGKDAGRAKGKPAMPPQATTEFWPESATDASWLKLQEIRKSFPFTLIGGWAVYLWTRQHKSKDIDLAVDLETLYTLKKNFALAKNDRLKKYEIKFDLFDIDIYVDHYSTLALPAEVIRKNASLVEGFPVASPETLLLLKLGAWSDRKETLKGRKDAIDLLTLLLYAPVNWKAYSKLAEENRLGKTTDELVEVVRSFDPDDLKYVRQNVHSFKKWKTGFLEKMESFG